MMQIFVKTLSGDTNTINLVDASDTVESVKTQIEEVEGIPVEHQQLIFEGKELENGRELSFYKVRHESTLHLTMQLDGGRCIAPHLRYLAYHYVLNRNICRKCYCSLPPRATRCRKAKCGRTTDIRPKKGLYGSEFRRYFGKTIEESGHPYPR